MKRIHLVLLIAAAMTAGASIYSLAAINQVYTINYEWFSAYNKSFTTEQRSYEKDLWQLEQKPDGLQIGISTTGELDNDIKSKALEALDIDWSSNIVLWCTLGEVTSPEYSVKIADIAQRGDIVEVVISLNSPAKVWDKPKEFEKTYLPFDLVRVPRASLATKGKLLFIFKDQSGNQLYSQYVYVF